MTYERSAIRKWFFMGGDTCPLTGVRLTTTKVNQAAGATTCKHVARGMQGCTCCACCSFLLQCKPCTESRNSRC